MKTSKMISIALVSLTLAATVEIAFHLSQSVVAPSDI